MEVLTAYVREQAPWPPKLLKDTPPPPPAAARRSRNAPPEQDTPTPKGDPAAAEEQPPLKLATDIQAVLTVLGRRDRTHEEEDQSLDLSGTDLHDAQLPGAHLKGNRNLTVEQLCTVGTLYEAQLDLPLVEQIREWCPQLLKRHRK